MFGRDKHDEEDPFAALKDAAERGSTRISSGTAGAAPRGDEGNVSANASTGIPERERNSGPRRRRNAGWVLLLIVLSLGGSAAVIWQLERDAPTTLADSDDGSPERSGDGSPGEGRADDEQRRNDDDRRAATPRTYDLVRAVPFARTLDAIGDRLRRGERVWLLRVARDRVTALTRTRSGDQRSISVDAQLQTTENDSGSAGSHRGMALSRILPTAPEQALRLAAREGRIAPRRFDYMVMTTPITPGDRADWSIFFRDVPSSKSHWNASLDGRTVGRPGESTTTSSSLTITTNGRTRTITGAEAARIGACIRRAGSDGARIQACLP